MSIKEQIAALPDAYQESPSIIVTTASLEIADLKALADSHTRLLEAAKALVETWGEVTYTDPDSTVESYVLDGDRAGKMLCDAITEAWKL